MHSLFAVEKGEWKRNKKNRAVSEVYISTFFSPLPFVINQEAHSISIKNILYIVHIAYCAH